MVPVVPTVPRVPVVPMVPVFPWVPMVPWVPAVPLDSLDSLGSRKKGTCNWPLPTSMCFLQICLSERHLATFNQLVLFANLHVRSPVGHFQPASEFALR